MTSCLELRGMSTQDGRHDVIIHRSLPQGDLTAHSDLRVKPRKTTIYISLAVLLRGTYQPFRYAVLNVSTKFYQSNRFERVNLHL